MLMNEDHGEDNITVYEERGGQCMLREWIKK